MEEDPENGKIHNEMDNEREDPSTLIPTSLSQLDFFQVNLFTYCPTDSTCLTHSSNKTSWLSLPVRYFS